MITDRHIERLWVQMTATYGHKWSSTYGQTDQTGAWLLGLEDLTPELLAIGWRRCVRDRHDEWPPSLPEFRSLCLRLPNRDTAVMLALEAPQACPLVSRMQGSLSSFDRQHMSRRELVSHYRAAYETCMPRASADVLGWSGGETPRVTGDGPKAIAEVLP